MKKLLGLLDLNKDGKIQWWEITCIVIGAIAAWYAISYFAIN